MANSQFDLSADVSLVATFPGIASADAVTPFAKKPGGTRPGYVGYSSSNELYMVKVEAGGYENQVIGQTSETAGVESFSAQLIRRVWGAGYASDIRVTACPGTLTQTGIPVNANAQLVEGTHLKPLQVDAFKTNRSQPFAVVVPYIDQTSSVATWLAQDGNRDKQEVQNRMSELSAISEIIGVSDRNHGNFLLNESNQIMLIDCAVNLQLNLDNLNKLSNSDSVKKVKEKFIDFLSDGGKKLDALLDQYKEFLSASTIKDLKEKIMGIGRELEKDLALKISVPLSEKIEERTQERAQEPALPNNQDKELGKDTANFIRLLNTLENLASLVPGKEKVSDATNTALIELQDVLGKVKKGKLGNYKEAYTILIDTLKAVAASTYTNEKSGALAKVFKANDGERNVRVAANATLQKMNEKMVLPSAQGEIHFHKPAVNDPVVSHQQGFRQKK